MTLYCARQVAYAGRVTCDAVLRNVREFRPKPGEALLWTVTELDRKNETQRGKATVDENGLVPIPGLRFDAPARLVLRRAGEGSEP